MQDFVRVFGRVGVPRGLWRGTRAALALVCGLGLTLGMAACASEPGGARSGAAVSRAGAGAEAAATITARGKVRDLNSAVSRAITTRNLAVLEIDDRAADEGVRVFRLLGIRGEPGWVRATFEPTGPSRAAGREVRAITIAAQLGSFGDAAREEDFVRGVAGELEVLATQD